MQYNQVRGSFHSSSSKHKTCYHSNDSPPSDSPIAELFREDGKGLAIYMYALANHIALSCQNEEFVRPQQQQHELILLAVLAMIPHGNEWQG